MGIQLIGNAGTVAEVDGATFRALRVTHRPIDHGALGHYQIAAVTGTMSAALAAGAPVIAFRWGNASNLAVIQMIRVRFQTLTLFTAATLTDFGFNAHVARAYTASHAGGVVATLTGNNAKRRTNMGTSLVTEIRASVIGALTGGTLTLDTQAFANSIGDPQRVNPVAATEEQRVNDPTLDWSLHAFEHPLVLAQDEGFVISNRAVWPAAGTGIFAYEIRWAEVTAY